MGTETLYSDSPSALGWGAWDPVGPAQFSLMGAEPSGMGDWALPVSGTVHLPPLHSAQS